ncbi:hypothetical protein HYQ30_gp102 [Salmonella phage heyday]|nr:hypothetical protein HYQ30_gp102 [Salmonella phage heyday]YP_009888216.1 hypothetical protein HYQ33_gp100 [Salmonella phage aagejoakim]YP_009888419.1 hypothetical protein HYQ34_gp097 [Salmonella phage dinky]QIO02250.1 hypothetical protein heyday_102 [Salmonella phage heyday]QIO02698.1 hypothetical protein aagejoakim_100 [Salmonella phage aagejoakim]QIO02901.1 hypothetical protein dinky_97 [Salmonella phage dinky]
MKPSHLYFPIIHWPTPQIESGYYIMTNSEIYHASMHYHDLRARPGHAKQKAFWVAELRLRRAVVNHQIIMNRKNDKSPLLADSYLELRTAYEQAKQHVIGA